MPKRFLALPPPHCMFLLTAVLKMCFLQDSLSGNESNAYSFDEASPDGIGKYYMGREISKVMGHLGAGWLERPQREREERTDLLVENLNLQHSDQVVDLGAGSGYFTFRIAQKIPEGKVYAVDISKEMLGIVRAKIKKLDVENVTPVHGTVTDFDVGSGTIDSILVVDAYHEFSHPLEMGKSIFEALKPGGQLVLIEYRLEDPLVPIKRLHKMSQKQAIKELSATGLQWVKTLEFLPQQHFMIFQKPKS